MQLLRRGRRFDFEPTDCILCEVDDAKLLHTIDHFAEGQLRFVQCNRCGLVYQNPRPTPESLAHFFTTGEFVSAEKSGQDFNKLVGYSDYLAGEAYLRKMAAHRLKLIRRFTGNRKLDILKIGCGPGVFLAVAKEHGHRPLGVDASEYFCAVGSERFGVDIINSSFEDVELGSRRFDVIMIMGVLGNLNNDRLCLEKARRHLTDDGLLFLNYITTDSLLLKMQGPRHFHFRPPSLYLYPKKTLQRLLQVSGYKLVSQRREIQYTNLSKLLWFARIKPLWALTKVLPAHRIVFPLPVPGAYTVFARKAIP